MMFGVTVNSVASLAFAFLAPYRPPLNALSTYASIYLYLSLSISHTIERFFFFGILAAGFCRAFGTFNIPIEFVCHLCQIEIHCTHTHRSLDGIQSSC